MLAHWDMYQTPHRHSRDNKLTLLQVSMSGMICFSSNTDTYTEQSVNITCMLLSIPVLVRSNVIAVIYKTTHEILSLVIKKIRLDLSWGDGSVVQRTL